MVREAILNIMTDGNIIINQIEKKKKRNPNMITYEQTQIIKKFTPWVIVWSNMWKDANEKIH